MTTHQLIRANLRRLICTYRKAKAALATANRCGLSKGPALSYCASCRADLARAIKRAVAFLYPA